MVITVKDEKVATCTQAKQLPSDFWEKLLAFSKSFFHTIKHLLLNTYFAVRLLDGCQQWHAACALIHSKSSPQRPSGNPAKSMVSMEKLGVCKQVSKILFKTGK